MAFTIETVHFYPLSKGAVTWQYYIRGVGSAVDAYNAFVAYLAPVNLAGSYLQSVETLELLGYGFDEVWFLGQATYGPGATGENPGPLAAGSSPASGTADPPCRFVGFSLGVTTAHVTQSLANKQNKTHSSKTPPNYYGTIGVTEQGGAEGADKLVGTKTFTLEKRLPMTVVTDDWFRDKVEPLQLHVNGATFRGHPAGSVLFTEASGSAEGNVMVMTFQFAVEKNVTGLTVDRVTGINKRGHEYIWFRHVSDTVTMPAVGAAPAYEKSITRLDSAHVEEMYPEGDFSVLGLEIV